MYSSDDDDDDDATAPVSLPSIRSMPASAPTARKPREYIKYKPDIKSISVLIKIRKY